MFTFFSNVWGAISTALEFLEGIVITSFKSLEFLSKSFSFPMELAGYMPSILGTAVTCFFAVYALKFVAGK